MWQLPQLLASQQLGAFTHCFSLMPIAFSGCLPIRNALVWVRHTLQKVYSGSSDKKKKSITTVPFTGIKIYWLVIVTKLHKSPLSLSHFINFLKRLSKPCSNIWYYFHAYCEGIQLCILTLCSFDVYWDTLLRHNILGIRYKNSVR